MVKRTAKDYEEMSRAVESGEYAVRGPAELGATLQFGRPIKGTEPAGNTPALPVRLPRMLRAEIDRRVEIGESESASHLIRRAVIEYLERHPQALFEDISRTDASPGQYTESTFEYLNRSARPEADQIRDLLDGWFASYPDDQKRDLKSRFARPEYSEHLGAWWELYVFNLYRTLGYSVDVHPRILGSTHRPDFLVYNSEESFYVECTAVSPADHSGAPNLKGQNWIQDCINHVLNPNFHVGLRIEQFGTDQPRQTEITRPLSEWLATLDPYLPADALPPLEIRPKDWRITITAYPIPPEKRGGTGRLLGILLPSGAFFINDVDVIHKALREKGSRYGGQPDRPLVVALVSTSGFTEEEDITDAVFGRKAVQYTEGQANPVKLVRQRNGYWRAGPPRRGARVSAVLFGQRLNHWTAASAFPKLWLNPWGYRHLNATEPFSTFTLPHETEPIKETDGKGGASLLGLPPSWPR